MPYVSDVIKQQKPLSGHKVVSWRRHSMRKTRPILLPKPDDDNNPYFTPTTAVNAIFDDNDINIGDDVGRQNVSSPTNESTNDEHPIRTDVVLERVRSNEIIPIDLLSITNSVNDGYDDIDDDLQYNNCSTMRSRCQFRNIYQEQMQSASGPQSLQSDDMLDVLAIAANANDGVRDYANINDMRPRQLGRRSEPRNRIVSITAERNSEGDQVIKNSFYAILFK